MKGDLTASFMKNGKKINRKLNPDRIYISKDGGKNKSSWKSFILNRNVGHLMTSPQLF